jgi:ribokinase
MAADLWVLGNLTTDDLVLADGTTAMGLCGGNAIFAAMGGRLWSRRVGLSARIGPDYPRAHVESLEAAGIELALSPTMAPSIHSWALYETADRRRFINWLDSGSHLDQSLLPAEVPGQTAEARVCHIAPMPLEVQSKLVHHLAGESTLVSIDPHDAWVRGAPAGAVGTRRSLFAKPSGSEAALWT